MNELIDEIDRETNLTPVQTEKVIHRILDFIEQDMPLSEKTEIDLKIGDIREEELEKDRQHYPIP